MPLTLPPDLETEVSRLAQSDGIPVDELVAEAMRQFLKLRQQEQFEAEARAYEAMHESLLGKYRGKFVAVYQGRVIDADADKRALIARVFARYRRSPVYFQQVTEEKIPTVRIRTPRFSRA